MDIMSIALALGAEHEQRTGHKQTNDPLVYIGCDVCMHLRSFWREAEREQNEALTREHKQS